MTYNIQIDIETADAIVLIHERYFFDLFKEIQTDREEEFAFRDALATFAGAYSQAVEDYILTGEEREQSYNYQADRCN